MPPLLAKARRIFKPSGDNGFTWLRENASFENEEAAFKPGRVFVPLSLPRSFNRILDNSARELYAPVIAQMESAMPKTMAKKIPEANVQQAFALDAVYSFASGIASPKILCIGSYESTDAMFLKQAGFNVEEIDPVLNYSLDEFFSRPSTLKNTYDIIFSTSVIEHVEEDELFVRQMADLLRPGGTGVITCDFREGYVKGDPKPEVDFRFYTREDLASRLLTCLPDCQLLDPPRWDGAEPDFHYGGYTYTFATFCFRKNA
jgi:SAM-dependent methyltransferase